jgi:SET domain-containing protein
MYYEELQKLLTKYREFEMEWNDFNQTYTFDSHFPSYLNYKIQDLEKDLQWLRKETPKNTNQR